MPFSNSVFVAAAALTALAGMGAAFVPDLAASIKADVQLRAMQDELARAKTLQLPGLDKPYYIRYSVDDVQQSSITASLGGLTGSDHLRWRNPDVEVRIGSYAFDNTNSVYTGRPKLGLLTVDDDYDALRDGLWLLGDGLYKTAAAEITAKRNALREVANPETTPDFATAQPVQILRPVSEFHLDQHQWEATLRRVSQRFIKYPALVNSNVHLLAIAGTYRMVNTEGSVVRVPENLASFELFTSGLTSDGEIVRNSYFFTALDTADLPAEGKLLETADQVAAQADALRTAAPAEDFSGPILFEQQAAAQLIAEVLADASRVARKPVAPPGSNTGSQIESVWASRMGTAVTPPWMTIVDDPLQTSFQGQHLAGHYEVDDEGVTAMPATLVEKGTLKSFLTSRQPARNINGSNGHGRLPGAFGAESAVIGNLFVRVSQPTPEAQMKQQLIAKTKAAGLKYGLLIRKLDFPSTISGEEFQGIGRQAQKSGYARTITPPLVAYRVYLDGHEELVRGVRFKEFSAKDLRDVAAASDKPYVFNYLNKGGVFNFAELGTDATTSTVVCPSLLFDSVETERAQDEVRKSPVVPAPALSAQ